MIRLLTTIAFALAAVYLMTAVIMGTGGPGERLVLKPFHGVVPFYGGGEENSWIMTHSGKELPWWHYPNQDYLATIWQSSSETSTPLWLLFYGLGFYFWILLLVVLLPIHGVRFARRRAEQDAAANP